MHAIGVTGLRCSGKDTVAEIISREYGFKKLDYTKDLLAQMLVSQGKEISRENLVFLATEIRKRGVEEPTKLLAEKINGDTVISGLRFREEADFLREKFGDKFTLIAVKAEDKIRWQRAVKRGIKGERELSFESFMEKENLPTEKVIPETMEMAAFILENNSTPEKLRSQIVCVMDNVIKTESPRRDNQAETGL